MKIVVIFSLLFLLLGCASNPSVADSSQSLAVNGKIEIKPGVGIGEILLGMTPLEVVRVLGQPALKITFDEEYRSFSEYGYVPEEQVVFFNRFDFLLRYDKSSGQSEIYPVFKLYFKNGLLKYINLSTYGFTIDERVVLLDRPAWGDLSPTISRLGPYKYRVLKFYDGEFFWFNKGILLISEEKKVKAIHIFNPIEKKRAAEFTVFAKLLERQESTPKSNKESKLKR